MQDKWSAAVQTMLGSNRQAEAISTVAAAASRGDPAAYLQQALWRLTGHILPRDLSRAREDLSKAAVLGNGEARLVYAALLANGSGGPPDWAESMRLLTTGCEAGEPHARHLQSLLAAMPLNADGAPNQLPVTETLTADGSVRRASTFLSPGECAHLANSASDLLSPAVVVDPRTGRSIPHPIRTSDAAVLSPLREDPVIRAINVRVAAISRTQVEQGEALTILRYRPGQQFRLHSDVLPQVRNQRVMTVLLYLNDGFSGGETIFPDHGLTIVPKAGDALMFDNVGASGRALASARHAGAPVTRGTKWLATRWIRARPFDVWTGPEAV